MKTPFPPLPPISKTEQQVLDRLEARQRQHPTPLSPCVDQTRTEIEAYYRTAPVGAVAVVRHTQGHLLRYDVSHVDGRNPKIGRVYVHNAGAFYMKSGANCFHPKGQTTLVVPTEKVLAWAKAHPRGEFDIAIAHDL